MSGIYILLALALTPEVENVYHAYRAHLSAEKRCLSANTARAKLMNIMRSYAWHTTGQGKEHIELTEQIIDTIIPNHK